MLPAVSVEACGLLQLLQYPKPNTCVAVSLVGEARHGAVALVQRFIWVVFRLTVLVIVCAGCGTQNTLSQRDQVRCRVCGYRIFYKVRTDRCECTIGIIHSSLVVQFVLRIGYCETENVRFIPISILLRLQ